jgi:hypothetical protein
LPCSLYLNVGSAHCLLDKELAHRSIQWCERVSVTPGHKDGAADLRHQLPGLRASRTYSDAGQHMTGKATEEV